MTAPDSALVSNAAPSRIGVVICAAFLVVGSLVVAVSWAAYFADSEIERHGVRAEGVVVKKELVRSADGDSDFRVAYRFQLPSGQQIQAERHVPKAVWQALRPGAPVTIQYAAQKPGRNFPAGSGVTSMAAPIMASVVFGSLAVLGGLLLVGMYRARHPTVPRA